MEARDIVIRPLITEKSTALMEEGRYVFVVDKRANKIQIAQAIAEIFKVKVTAVNTVNVGGKTKRMHVNRRQASPKFGRRPGYKKAIVKLAQGETIQFFGA